METLLLPVVLVQCVSAVTVRVALLKWAAVFVLLFVVQVALFNL
jgi:hypothetical protein